MNFIISSSVLLKELQNLIILIKNINSLPILDNFLFDFREKNLFIIASDLQINIISKIIIKSNIIKKIAVPARLITNIIKTFPEQPLNIFLSEKNILKIKSQQGEYDLTFHNGDDFPTLDNVNNEKKNFLTLKTSDILNIIEYTLFATSSDDFRPIINGVFFNINNKFSTFVGTDSHRLVKYERKDIFSEEEFNFIIPKKSLNILKNIIIKLKNDQIIIKYNNNNVSFSIENKIIISRLIDGIYPDYESVIPNTNNKELIINRLYILNLIKRLSFFSDKNTSQIYLELSKNKSIIRSENTDFSNKAKEYLDCNYIGDNINIGFNSKIIIEMIFHLKSKDIIFKLSNNDSACILESINESSDNENILMLIMPIIYD